MKKQRIVSILLTFCLILSMIPTAFAVDVDNFTDVSKTDWFYDYVDYVTDKEYFVGTSETTFSPNTSMTRAMFVVVLARFDKVKVDNSQSAFTDVEPGSWCAGAVNWAAENKIVAGIGNGKFDPNASITRAQMCAIMDRYVDYYTAKHKVTVAKPNPKIVFGDQDQIPAYAKTSVDNCRIYGLINGYEDGSFHPQDTSTRAHVATVIYRLHFLIDDAKPSSSSSSSGSSSSGGRTYYDYKLTYMDGSTELKVAEATGKPSSSWTFDAYDLDDTDSKTFKGWSKTEGGSTADYAKGESIKLDSATGRTMTVWAVWEDVPVTEWEIKYQYVDENGETVIIKTETVADGKDHTVLDGSEAGIPDTLVLLDWSDEDDNIYVPGDVIKSVSKNITLTARCIKADDYIGNAVKAAMDQINSKYQLADANISYSGTGAYIDPLSFNGSEDDTNEVARPQTLSAGASVSDDIAVKVIEAATEIACELVGMDSSDLPSAGEAKTEIKQIVNDIIDVVEEELGIDILRADSVEETVNKIVNAVYEKVILPEGKALWANFYDENGNYYCGDITVETTSSSDTYTATLKVNQDNHSTTLDGSKKDAVKHVAASIARQMFASLNEQANGKYISDPTLEATVNVTFADGTQYGEATAKYPHKYPVNMKLALEGNDLVSYKYDGTSYLKLTITKDIQETWNNSLTTFAGVVTDDPEMKQQVIDLVQQTIDEQVGGICESVQKQLDPYGIKLENTNEESLKAALDPEVKPWVEANWNAIIDSAASGEMTGLDTTALVDAAWSVVEQDVPKGNDLDATIQTLVDSQLESAGIDENYLVRTVNETLTSDTFMSGAVKTFIDLGATFKADGASVSIPVESVDDINTLLSCDKLTAEVTYGTAKVTVNVSGEADEDGNEGSFSEFIRPEVVSQAGDMLTEQLSGHATLQSLIGDNKEMKDYIIYSALVRMGLEFETEKAEATSATITDEDGNKVALMDYLADLIEELGKKEIGEKLNAEIAMVDVSEYIAENTEYEQELALYNGMKFPSIMDKQISNVSKVLRNTTLQNKIGTTGDSYVKQYLAKAINKIPAGAKVTINGEEIDKTDLAKLAEAKTTVEAMNAVADILDGMDNIKNLTLNSFAEPGIPVTITYNQRNFSFNLVIEAE